MPAGISAYLANKLLDHAARSVAYTPPSKIYAKMHFGNPGANGTGNSSTQATRLEVVFGPASSGAISMTNAPEFTLVSTEEISYVSFWDSAGPTGGNFLWSAQAITPKSGAAEDIIRVSTNSFSFGALAS